jgi:hypothetical protein
MRITGYTYRADNYCPRCMGKLATDGDRVPGNLYADQVEQILDALAHTLGVNREDEWSFDSDGFPKVILSTDDDEIECGRCGGNLGEIAR